MPEQRSEKISVAVSAGEIAIADAIAFILSSTRSEIVRSGFLNYWRPGGTEYHTKRSDTQPVLTPAIIEVLEDVNQHDNDLSHKLRLKFGLRDMLAGTAEGKEAVAEMLANMKQNAFKGMKSRQE